MTAWEPDLLDGYHQHTVELGADPLGEGDLLATLVRRGPARPARRAVLAVHGYTDYFFNTELADRFAAHDMAFYALDLHKCGRSWREGQTPHFATDLAEYHRELERAVAIIASETDGADIWIYGHSAGGLIVTLWLDRLRERGLTAALGVTGLILNSPFLDLHGPAILRTAPTSAALIAIALAAGIPPTKFKGTDVGTNQAMISSLAMSVNPEAALGFVSTEVADLNRDSVRTLAFQAKDQLCAYWPDSTSTGFDKRNVRDGHYDLWSPYRFYAPVDGEGEIVDATTRRFVGYFTGAVEVPEELPLLDIIIDNGNLPECAMQVWRDEEIGPLYSRQAEAPCGCYYEARATGASSCTACADDAGCGGEAPKCRYGYCEVI